MDFTEYQDKLSVGLVLGQGTYAYTVEKITEENTYLRGTPEGQRQETRNVRGSRRIIVDAGEHGPI
jgi:hypothetical protein